MRADDNLRRQRRVMFADLTCQRLITEEQRLTLPLSAESLRQQE